MDFFIHTFLVLVLIGCLDASDKKKSVKSKEGSSVDAVLETESEPFGAVAIQSVQEVSDQFFSIMGYPYKTHIARHLTHAQAQFVPYAGSWYPESEGGTNSGGALTKYDQAFGTKSAAWEATVGNHTVSSDAPTRDWEGHCNGFAGAATRHAEPPEQVSEGGTTFSPADIKALLAEIYMSAKYFKLGGNRCERTSPSVRPDQRPDPQHMGECEDVNPAEFHLAVVNVMGGAERLPLIMDISLNNQVWNYPFYKYRCRNCTGDYGWQKISVSEAMRKITGSSSGSYPFNSQMRELYFVQMELTRRDAARSELVNTSANTDQYSAVHVYSYVLEVDEAGQVIGGEWAGDDPRGQSAKTSQQDHPDLVWMALDSAGGNGNARYANPHISVEKVLDLWRRSWKGRGGPPFEAKQEPVWRTNWGDRGDYLVSLNGLNSGAVFLGERTKLRIEAQSSRLQGDKVEIYINDQPRKSFVMPGGGQVDFDFDAHVGMNVLSLRFIRQGGEQLDTFRFYGIP